MYGASSDDWIGIILYLNTSNPVTVNVITIQYSLLKKKAKVYIITPLSLSLSLHIQCTCTFIQHLLFHLER